ncbi:MAG TPA: fatty acid--CoA ligase family protein, partial [Acidimicrobiales bacterium]
RVVGDDGAEVPAGQVGELQVKGPGVLKAYWGDDAATAAVLTDDGWLRTGDLARKGPLGLLVFEGRSKHVIKHGGYSVYALEVEQALEQHPDVLEASVIGLPDATLGEVPAAVVRLAPHCTTTAEDLLPWAAERLSDYKVPKRAIAVEELPRTGTAKVQKQALVELFG